MVDLPELLRRWYCVLPDLVPAPAVTAASIQPVLLDWLKTESDQVRQELLDSYQWLLDLMGKKQLFPRDGVHMSREGISVLAGLSDRTVGMGVLLDHQSEEDALKPKSTYDKNLIRQNRKFKVSCSSDKNQI